jgi:hypothetical protein
MLADPQRFNLYAYVRNNPLRYIDPKGEEIELFGNEEERQKLLAAIKNAVGTDAAKYLTEKKKTSWFGLGKTRYVVGVSDQKAFAATNAVAGELSPMID